MMTSKPDESPGEHEPDSMLAITWPWLPVLSSEENASTVLGEAELVWNKKDASLLVGDKTLGNPLVYSSEGAPCRAEASCIDTTLEVNTLDPAGDSDLGYWPHYANLTPAQRNAYLEWLATGRKDPLTDYGYLFLFFFGLERRILVDGDDPEIILRELLILLNRYGDSEAFYNTASHFIAFVFAMVKIGRIRKNWFQRLFVKPKNNLHEDSLIVALTWLYRHEEPLPATLAYQVALQDTRCGDSVVLLEAQKKFRQLFIKRYTAMFPDGLIVGIAEESRIFAYRPLNPSLQGWRVAETLNSVELPDVLGDSAQFTPLVEIWNACIEELRPTISTNDTEGWINWNALVASCTDDRGRVFTTIGHIVDTHGIAPAYRTSLSMQQSLDLIDTARTVQLAIEPHPDGIFRPYRTDDPVAIVPIDSVLDVAGENHYLAATLMLGLGVGMAAADGVIDQIELLHLPGIVNAQFHFAKDDRKRIMAYGELLLEHPPELAPIASRLRRELEPEELKGLGEFLIGIAASNGVVEASEMQTIVSVYHAFGLSMQDMTVSLDRLDYTPPESGGIDGEIVDHFLGGLRNVASRISDAYKRIRSERKRYTQSLAVDIHAPAVKISTWPIDAEFSLTHQYEHYDEDTDGAHHSLGTTRVDGVE